MKILTFFLTPLFFLLPLWKFSNTDFNENLTPPTVLENKGEGTIVKQKKGTDYRIKKVVIDAGHGGHDSGCESSYGMEKKNTLAIALNLGHKIKEAFPQVEIIYTREKDEFIELYERAAIANRAKADLFISIHCNSTDGVAPQGTETYVLGTNKMETNLAVSKRENAAILLENDYEKQYNGFDPNSNEAYIIFSLHQNTYLDKSILFGKFVEESFKVNAGRRSLGVKQAGFIVLHQSAMPSVLVETGFLNNAKEGAYISSESGQESVAECIMLAFRKYKKNVESKEDLPEEITFNTEGGVVFKVQLATSSQDLRNDTRWQSIENLEVMKDRQLYKYYHVVDGNYNNALTALRKMRASGFNDAFLVAFKDGKKVSLDAVK
jgi:N-acetylmuramoyl-L-alanine amidase